MTDDEFLVAFEAAAIARKDWTHEAHVRMAWLLTLPACVVLAGLLFSLGRLIVG